MSFLPLTGLLLLVIFGRSHSWNIPRVRTKLGTVEGRMYWYRNMSMYAYVGIPFAKPPVGERRFKKPQVPTSWKGIYKPNHWPKTCHPHNEDCLYLNVFVPPEVAPNNTLPTVVWIHGGAFQYGTGNRLRPHYFLRNNNMALVTIEYRLGILGFLYAGNEEAPGNVGLFDQQMALRWVKDNIGRFGGDGDRITVLGFSAGSASVNYHMTSPISRGLFSKAIIVSGAVTSSFAYNPASVMKEYFDSIAEYFNCSKKGDDKKSVRCLRNFPADVIAQAYRAFPRGMGLHPTVDGELVTGPPSSIVGNGSSIPLLAIVNKDEGIGWAREFFLPSLDTPALVRDKIRSTFDDRISQLYFAHGAMLSLQSARRASVDVMSDMVNLCPIRNMVKMQARMTEPVYQIVYNHYHEEGDDFWSREHPFVNHLAIHPFIFGDAVNNRNYSHLEKKMAERINRMLTNFIISG